ncbi:MAG: hypothetical protein AMXMBFR7_35890 [Planctomycetota bacterium]
MSTVLKPSPSAERLAALGGPKAVQAPAGDLLSWPQIGAEDEAAVLDVLRRGAMSGTDVTLQFEQEFAAWHGVKFALAHPNGTSAILAALFGCGVGPGDEVIAPSFTFWASCTQALSLGAKIVFAEAEPHSLCIDPRDVEKRITPRTKAIVATHYCAHPADMDALMALARPRGIKVIEDVSHAHGALYKGRLCGTLGDAAGMSLMSGKSLIAGEAGMLITQDRKIFERAVAFGHYERTQAKSKYFTGEPYLTDPELAKYAGIPLGGCKHRLNQLASALGRVQLKQYARRMEEIQRAMTRFWDLIEREVESGVRGHRPAPGSGSTMGGWYYPHGLYEPAKMNGVPVARFCAMVAAEGIDCGPGANVPLHLHPLFADRGCVIEPLPVTESLPGRCFGVPWFKHDRAEQIEAYARGVVKVVRAIQSGEAR